MKRKFVFTKIPRSGSDRIEERFIDPEIEKLNNAVENHKAMILLKYLIPFLQCRLKFEQLTEYNGFLTEV